MTPEASRALAEAGPWAVVIFIGAAVGIALVRALVTLWREHKEADADDRAQRDRAFVLLETSLAGNREATAAASAMAAAWDERNRIDDAIHRRAD